jgi:hypothetical protein
VEENFDPAPDVRQSPRKGINVGKTVDNPTGRV